MGVPSPHEDVGSNAPSAMMAAERADGGGDRKIGSNSHGNQPAIGGGGGLRDARVRDGLDSHAPSNWQQHASPAQSHNMGMSTPVSHAQGYTGMGAPGSGGRRLEPVTSLGFARAVGRGGKK